jgi:hypothetical protein
MTHGRPTRHRPLSLWLPAAAPRRDKRREQPPRRALSQHSHSGNTPPTPTPQRETSPQQQTPEEQLPHTGPAQAAGPRRRPRTLDTQVSTTLEDHPPMQVDTEEHETFWALPVPVSPDQPSSQPGDDTRNQHDSGGQQTRLFPLQGDITVNRRQQPETDLARCGGCHTTRPSPSPSADTTPTPEPLSTPPPTLPQCQHPTPASPREASPRTPHSDTPGPPAEIAPSTHAEEQLTTAPEGQEESSDSDISDISDEFASEAYPTRWSDNSGPDCCRPILNSNPAPMMHWDTARPPPFLC